MHDVFIISLAAIQEEGLYTGYAHREGDHKSQQQGALAIRQHEDFLVATRLQKSYM